MESRIAQITHFARTFRSILSLPTFTPMQLFDAIHYASDKVGKQVNIDMESLDISIGET